MRNVFETDTVLLNPSLARTASLKERGTPMPRRTSQTLARHRSAALRWEGGTPRAAKRVPAGDSQPLAARAVPPQNVSRRIQKLAAALRLCLHLHVTMSLRNHLLSLNADLLKGWLRRMDALEKGLTRKDQFAAAIERQLTLDLAHVVGRLSEPEKCWLAESVRQKRLFSAREFTAKYGGACPMPKSYYGRREEVSLLVPFIYQGNHRESEPPGLIAALIDPLRALLPKPAALKLETADRVPKAWPSEQQCPGGELIRPIHVFEGERIAPVELGRVLRLIQGGKVKVTDATHRPTDATTRLIGGALVVPDFDLEMPESHRTEWEREYYTPAGPVRAHAWPVLVQQCGWAKAKGGGLILTDEGRAILQTFTAEKFRDGVSRLLANGDFDELNRINHIRGQSGKAKRYLSNPALRKTAIAGALEALPVGAWLKFEEACRQAEASPENWDVVESGYGVLYFCELQYGCIHETTGISRQFLRAFLMESLATLGVLDIAYVYPHQIWPDLDGLWGTDDLDFCGRYDGLLYVRLNPLGAYALGCTDQYEVRAEEKPKLFQVLPNLGVALAEGELNPADRATLELMAAPTSESAWTLDAERILTHVESGGAIEELRDFLESHAAEGLPESVQLWFAGLDSNLGACRVRRDAVLLEWADEALARLIATNTSTAKLCFHAGENRLVVPAGNLGAFGRALKRLGFALPPASARTVSGRQPSSAE